MEAPLRYSFEEDRDVQTQVLITVDTEVWPRSDNWRETSMAADMDRDIYGITNQGEYGLGYQLDVLNRFGLTATFFVESLFASAVGPSRLREIVALIKSHRQDVQLHVHPEWLQWMSQPVVLETRGKYLKQFTTDEQCALIGLALNNLLASGAEGVCAFRAGNYGANLDTLRALSRLGLRFDTSYNFPYLATQCGMALPEPLLQPRCIDGVIEYPITFFEDWPHHPRHLQLTACSSAEIIHVLIEARRRGRQFVVLVSHGFELLRNRKTRGKPLRPDEICIARFEQLCRFLADRRDEFQTSTFSDLTPLVATEGESDMLRSNPLRTVGRYVQQAMRRIA